MASGIQMRHGGRMAAELRRDASQLALQAVDEALAEGSVPSLARLPRHAQLGRLPALVKAVAGEVNEPHSDRLRRGGGPVALIRDHAREREALGFSPREIVIELLLVRRAL